MPIDELDLVALTEDLPIEGLRKGDVGCVVLVHGQGRAYEVEFVAPGGDTLAIVTVPRAGLRPVRTE